MFTEEDLMFNEARLASIPRRVAEVEESLDRLPVLALVYNHCDADDPLDINVKYISPFTLKKLETSGDESLERLTEGLEGYDELAPEVFRRNEEGGSKELVFRDSLSDACFIGTLCRVSPGYVMMYFNDIRTIVLDNVSLNRAAKVTGDKNEQFVRSLAHDLKEPARSVVGFTEILLSHGDSLAPEQYREYLERANVGALRLHEMIQELRNYALSERPVSNVEPMMAEEVIRQGVELIKDRIRAEGVNLDVNIGFQESMFILAGSLKRVVFNFLDNAIKYRSEDPLHIELTATVEKDFFFLSVSDNGIGFDSEDAGRIFEPFHRLDPHQDAAPGVGMGLAICKDIVTSLGGRIWGTSAGSGKGANFCFRVPIK
jgi:signal transduction histidine kinase